MPTAVLDERGRVVLPREVAQELGAAKGDVLLFEMRGKDFVVAKAASKQDTLEALMDWNPARTGKIEGTSPRALKGIWKT